ncbi:hypothetical protein HK414_09225 [Ramlibacter terrae]|uniref:Uncharacterized protein n=1 Tax=Ramlibacter terrae TaxID=2732511 RepID=A0ABX6P3V1_9BURK|nr:hypothetical protein HK414_09225 [Ramlibacter terrae]
MNPFAKKPAAFADTEPLPNLSLATDDQYAATEPAPLAAEKPTAKPAPEPLGLSLAPIEAGEYELMAEIRKDNRVCPQPTRWLEFYRVLQENNAKGSAMPSTPLTGSARAITPTSAKRMCMREQAEWAVANNCVTPAYNFLKALPPSDWFIE